jgi:hypothetical protein
VETVANRCLCCREKERFRADELQVLLQDPDSGKAGNPLLVRLMEEEKDKAIKLAAELTVKLQQANEQ